MYTRLSLIAIFLLCISSTPFAAKIYKWVDEEGNVHYGERPDSGNAKTMNIKSEPSSHTAPAAENRRENAQKLLDSIAKERKEKQEAAEKSAKEESVRKENCSRAKKQAALLKQGGRMFEMTDTGERKYLDDATIQSRLQEAEKAVKEYCQ